MPLVAAALVITGTIFYSRFEDWTIIEALYFSILTTRASATLSPTTAGIEQKAEGPSARGGRWTLSGALRAL